MLYPQSSSSTRHWESSCWCEIRRRLDLLPFTRLGAGGRFSSGCFRSIRFLQLNMLRDIDPMVRIFNLEALLVHQANETCPRSFATFARSQVTSHDCRLSQAAECKLSSTVRHSSSCCSPGDAYWIGNLPIPLLHRPLKHYFYDLRSTPTPDTDCFTPRQRKQIQRLNPSCHIFSSSATAPPYAYNIGGCLLSSGASKGDSSLLSSLRSPSKFLIV